MIDELRIENLGVISSGVVRPGPGFTALTGETGAGKTMVLSALAMLLGGKVDSAIAEGAAIEGVWVVPSDHPALSLIEEAGGSTDDGEILLGRTATNGRLRAFAGGRMVPASLLAEIGEQLVTVHGQSTQQRLRGPAAQRAALDRFGGTAHEKLLAAHREAYQKWLELDRALQTANAGAQETEQRMVFLRSALEEIEKVDPQPGETEALHTEQNRLGNLADITAATSDARASLLGSDDDSVPAASDLLYSAARQLQSIDDAEVAALHARVVAAAEEVSDIGREVSSFVDGLQDDPGRLEWINQRLHDLARLQSRYGATDQDVIDWSQKAAAELVQLERGSDIAGLQAQEAAGRAELEKVGEKLSAARRKLATALAARATEELQQLAMPNASLEVVVSDGDLGSDGRDDVTFLLSAHPGATPAPIAKAASGGELSRIMLALEVVLADEHTGTFVFDEVDAGVGGAAATAIGRRLAQLAEHAQVIVVTHMPQVAAFAGTHLRVVKQLDADVTTSDVTELDDEQRVVEIARMLAGQEESSAAREHARELLDMRV